VPNRNLSISIDSSTFAVTITADSSTTVVPTAESIVCRFQDPGQSGYPRVIAVFSSAGSSSVSQWSLNSGYWESSSITSSSQNPTQFTQYVKIHALVRKSAESEETSTSPFVSGAGLQPILRDIRLGLELVDPNSDASESGSSEAREFREQPQV